MTIFIPAALHQLCTMSLGMKEAITLSFVVSPHSLWLRSQVLAGQVLTAV